MEERQYTDLAVLEAVEHPADMEVLMTPEGMPILFAAPQLRRGGDGSRDQL